MFSTGYIIRFIVIITAVAALLLSLLATTLKERHDRNEALFNKRAILSAVETPLGQEVDDMSDEEIQTVFDNQVEQVVLNMNGQVVQASEVESRGYKGGRAEDVDMAKEKKKVEENRIMPLFIFEEDGEKYYIVSVRGSGLWDEIWGNIAIKEDFVTIAGAAFDHKAETPGLGAEIKDNPAFAEQFEGTKLYDEEGNYTGIIVRKGGARNPRNEVDGISGATITSDGVTKMIFNGIRYYQPYFEIQLQQQDTGN